MAKYKVETDDGVFLVETEDPGEGAMAVGESRDFIKDAAKTSSSFLQKVFRGAYGKPAADIATKPITEPLKAGAEIIERNPEAALESIPILAGIGAGAATLGAGAIPSILAAGGAGMAGRAATQIGRSAIGLPAVSPQQPTIPFTKKQIPDIPGIPKSVSRPIIEGGTQAAMAGVFPAAQAVLTSTPVRALGRGAARVGQAFSGIKANEYGKLLKDPTAWLPEWLGGAKSIEKAGDAYGEAAKGAGLRSRFNPVPEHAATVKTTFKTVMEGLPENATEAEAIAWMKANAPRLSPQETLDAFRSTGKVLDAAVEGKDKEAARILSLYKDALRERLSTWSGEFAKASKEFARSSLGSKFSNLLPLNKYGTPSIGRAGFAALATGTMGGALASSPLAHALPVSLTGATLKAVEAASKSPGLAGAGSGLFSSIISRAKEKTKAKARPEKKPIVPRKTFSSLIAPGTTEAAAASAPPPAMPSVIKTPDMQAYTVAVQAFLNQDMDTTKKAAQMALKINPRNLEARRLLERVALKEGKDIDTYKAKR